GEPEDPDSKWARPQNDGSPLRVMALVDYVSRLIEQKKMKEARDVYLVIKKDLDYTVECWQDRCYDLWEDLTGYHFWTRILQRRALIMGGALVNALNEDTVAEWKQASQDLEGVIVKHYDDLKGFILSTLEPDIEGKKLNKILHLDAAVIGAIVKTVDFEDPFMGVDDWRVMRTVLELEKAFCDLYPINKKWIEKGKLGMGIGRYPQDTYDGHGQGGGNPWFLNTAWFAQYYSLLARKFIEQGEIEITCDNICFFQNIGIDTSPQTAREDKKLFNDIINELRKNSQGYLEWILAHIPKDGSMSEQVNGETGDHQGPEDLTWSYVELILAIDTYEKLIEALEERRVITSRDGGEAFRRQETGDERQEDGDERRSDVTMYRREEGRTETEGKRKKEKVGRRKKGEGRTETEDNKANAPVGLPVNLVTILLLGISNLKRVQGFLELSFKGMSKSGNSENRLIANVDLKSNRIFYNDEFKEWLARLETSPPGVIMMNIISKNVFIHNNIRGGTKWLKNYLIDWKLNKLYVIEAVICFIQKLAGH
ncbi:MAG: hypothetical protein KAJ14_05695, partial [Candidatus Omnitrophica bacterium]|nr:hypothetical protein [Candidatus Omnitrophota bacterium]